MNPRLHRRTELKSAALDHSAIEAVDGSTSKQNLKTESLFFLFQLFYIGECNRAFLAQMVERWPFKPMAVGSIPTEGVFLNFFFDD